MIDVSALKADMMKLARAFGRTLDAELQSLSPEAVRAGEMLRRFLPTIAAELHYPDGRVFVVTGKEKER